MNDEVKREDTHFQKSSWIMATKLEAWFCNTVFRETIWVNEWFTRLIPVSFQAFSLNFFQVSNDQKELLYDNSQRARWIDFWSWSNFYHPCVHTTEITILSDAYPVKFHIARSWLSTKWKMLSASCRFPLGPTGDSAEVNVAAAYALSNYRQIEAISL